MEPRALFPTLTQEYFPSTAQQCQLCPFLFASRVAGRAREHSSVAEAEHFSHFCSK
jgi:hypothetical protein